VLPDEGLECCPGELYLGEPSPKLVKAGREGRLTMVRDQCWVWFSQV
jgi:hypothetical protein